jgi:signal transduction histidine kinase
VPPDSSIAAGAWSQTWRLLVAAGAGVLIWLSVGAAIPGGPTGDRWFLTGDPLVALGCLALLVWRRRFPVAVAVVVALASTVSTSSTGAALLALASVATSRRPLQIAAVLVVFVSAASFAPALYDIPEPPGAVWFRLSVPVLSAVVAVAVGVAVGARRVEVRSLRDRADSAEREQAARAAQARTQERNRIAREMHDVLAHRISLVALQAGALDHRRDLDPEEEHRLVRGIADASHRALEELRDVLGVLRAEPDSTEPPQPSFDRIAALVRDARASGLTVAVDTRVTGAPPDALGRTCYRVVQEALTNAAKHAPGAEIEVAVTGAAGTELEVTVRNSAPTGTARHAPSSGFGLLGLTERIGLAGGTLDHHPTPDRGYLLVARLPWPAEPTRKETLGG